ncbi:F0F1 ATP synthase subunit epsilon [uncultured Umboniibacter sp.]|uniref:F0F1 ATP synthase subunit epsilon n=1 Tax=uncultured Umboniibacter sp. TaxID=1798917 RepID=UPI002626D778|nr:F0F1 ATP synthase subunit epsilon [uncultured Umboniibacter sp.]
MAMTIHLDIVSSGEAIFSGLVELLVASGEIGDLGVIYGHAPLLTSLKPGPVRVVKQGGEEEIFFLTGGFLEVQPHTVTVLADVATRAADLDESEAEKARDLAREEMSGTASGVDYQLAANRLANAAAQLRTIEQIRSMKR